MKFLLTSVAISAILTGSAIAADMRMPVKAQPPVVAPVYSWTGFYVGVHAGYGWGDSGQTFVGPVPPPFTEHNIDGFVGGLHAGINWQLNNNLVLGIEGAVSTTTLEGVSSCPNSLFRCHTDFDHFWRVGGRLGVTNVGVLSSNWLLYGMGGFARAKVKTFGTILFLDNEFDPDTVHHHGWYAGGGVEYALSPNFIIGVEAYHVSLDDKNHGSSRTVDIDFSVVQARLSYKFNWGGPVVARY
jgi:outer membrane immunogenic protein